MYVLFAFACSSGTPNAPGPAPGTNEHSVIDADGNAVRRRTVRQITHEQLKADIDAKKVKVLLDVRPAPDFERIRIEGAINIPVDHLVRRIQEMAPYQDEVVHLIGRSPLNSKQGANVLHTYGFTVLDASEGMNTWTGPTLSGPL